MATSSNRTWEMDQAAIGSAIRMACKSSFGVLESAFLCQSVSTLNPARPQCVAQTVTIGEVYELFCHHKIGSVLVINESGQLSGIFTERDFLLRAVKNYPANSTDPIKNYMTPNPVGQPPDITIAFALNLMSQGGFRHIPLVDSENCPVGIVSIRDLIDHIVGSFVEELLNFQTLEGGSSGEQFE